MTTHLKDIQQSKKYLLLDTNIIQYAGNKNKALSESVRTQLLSLEKSGYSIVISQYSVFENLQGLWGNKAEEATALLAKFEQKIVSKEVLVLSSILGGLYGRENDLKDIADGDKIIAATAMLTNAVVLTRNHRDFPIPFFIQENFYDIIYVDGDRKKLLDLGLYKPNTKIIESKVAELEPQNKTIRNRKKVKGNKKKKSR